NRTDVRVVQGGSGPGLAPQALQRVAVVGVPCRQELEGHVAAEPGVLGPVDHAHAAAAEPLQDAIVRDDLADGDRAGLGPAPPRLPHLGLGWLEHDTGATGRTPQYPGRSVSALAEGLQTVRADRTHGGWLSLSGPRGKHGLPHCRLWRHPGQQARAGTAWFTDSPTASRFPFAANPSEHAAVPVAWPAPGDPPRGGGTPPAPSAGS